MRNEISFGEDGWIPALIVFIVLLLCIHSDRASASAFSKTPTSEKISYVNE